MPFTSSCKKKATRVLSVVVLPGGAR